MGKDTENIQLSSVNYQLPSPPAEAHYTVYKLTDPEGKVYIGCTGKPVEQRWGKGWKYNSRSHIFKAIRSIGWDNFEKTILCEKLTRAGAEKLEKWFIAFYDSANPEKGYNRALGGLGKGVRMSEATKETCSKSICLLYEKDPEYRERVSKGVLSVYENDPDYRERVRRGVQAAYARDPSYQVRLSESKLKLFDNNYELSKKNQALSKNYYQTHAEAREEQSRRMKEYLSKSGNRAFVESSSKPRPVICVETGVVYPSQRAAEKATGFSNVHKACNGLLHTCGGYHWKNA